MTLFTRFSRLHFWILLATCWSALAQAPSRFEIPATDDGLPGAGPLRRADWFKNLWRQRRQQWAGEAARDQRAVVFLGDSITQGWGDQLATAFPGMKVANRGISGDTTRGVLIRLQEDVLSLNPSGVVLLIGTNDLEEQADPETIAANVRLILAALKAHRAEMPVLLCQVFPSSATKQRPSDKIKAVNKLYAAARKNESHITLLETWPLFANAAGDAKESEFPDLLHPNAEGYRKWAKALRPVFSTWGFLETEPDRFRPDPGFRSLFNGRDLTGWGFRVTPENDIKSAANWKKSDPNAPPWPVYTQDQHFRGKTQSSDGRYVARNGRLIVTPAPEGRRIQQLWTDRKFPHDFILRLEFRATPNADSGIFIRDPQLQCRDYPLAGPYKNLQHYRPQEWNQIEVTVTGRTALCTCNGEILEAAFKVPESGPIGLEGDLGQMEYRHIQIKEIRPRWRWFRREGK